jgi:putative ABC transport system ATP-binding protein
MENTMIQAQNISRTYVKGTVEVHALRNISFSLDRGEFAAIVGRSGSGKSTLLNLIGGLDTATSGHLFINHNDLTSMKRPDLTRHRRFTVGMIFQSFNLIPSRTALENVSLALAFGGVPVKKRDALAAALLKKVGLAERMYHKPGELSGGEAQRVAIARAMANHPAILLADEPTGNLDVKTSAEILDLLVALNRSEGVTILMVTHDEKSAGQTAHRIIQLQDGRIIHDTKNRGHS